MRAWDLDTCSKTAAEQSPKTWRSPGGSRAANEASESLPWDDGHNGPMGNLVLKDLASRAETPEIPRHAWGDHLKLFAAGAKVGEAMLPRARSHLENVR